MAEMKYICRLFDIKEEQWKLSLKRVVCETSEQRNEIGVAIMDLEVEKNEILDDIAKDATVNIDVKELLEQIGYERDIETFLKCCELCDIKVTCYED